ncbi:hypothetical protein C6B38_02925 [Spiroplasma sp. ChiS]|uniref:hypothetical protein n=1 Tax=Spiroplasma sp. ChiS TaxID=2099885 RepID=UPI000CF87C07|nr:hypothetical protein [Spiroplasma sp. ChiS]PQP78979.1 hypothetical protein C6B38_02925 [Spiroplasma sp. ChiS]
MENNLLEQVYNYEKAVYQNTQQEQKRIMAVAVHFEIPAMPTEIFEILYKFLNQDAKTKITKDSSTGQVFIRKFNNQTLHYVLTKNHYTKEIELATFIDMNLFKINFDLIKVNNVNSEIVYTESWRWPTALKIKYRQKKLFKQKVKDKGYEIKTSIFEQLK